MSARRALAGAALALGLALPSGLALVSAFGVAGPVRAGLAINGPGSDGPAETTGRLGHALVEIEAGEGYEIFAAPSGAAHPEASLFALALVSALDELAEAGEAADIVTLYAALNAEFGRLAERMPRQRPALSIRSTEPLPMLLPVPEGARALLVAQDYIAAGIPGLAGAGRDLALMAEALSRIGWAVETRLNPSGRSMLAGIAAFAAALGPGETGLIYLGGQGMLLPDGDRALAGGDFRLLAPDAPLEAGPEMMTFATMRALPLAPGAQVVVLTDAIFAEPRFLVAPREGDSQR